MNGKTRVLFDTDIGSDIDDAIALAYLLAQPECDLLGITTVTGDVVQRARLASALCRAAGKEVPIYPGAAECLLVPQKQPQVPQAAALDRWPHQQDFPRHEAVEFLARTIRRHPGEVTLLAVGPLTNVALLFAEHPDTAGLLRALVLMCGAFTPEVTTHRPNSKGIEWNARVDPHATAIVYRAPVPVHRSFGLDVTLQVTMDSAGVRRRFATGLLRPVLDFAEVWFSHRDTITFHDPLAAVGLFDPEVCQFERGSVAVDVAEGETQGMTRWQPDAGGPHEVALRVDSGRFFERYFGVFE